MANKIQIKRGKQAAVENLVLAQGELAVALDTGNVYVGIESGTYHVNPPTAAAETAKALETAREFSIAGDVTSNAVSFNGEQNVTLSAVLATISGLTAGTYPKVTVNQKGQVTAGTTLVASDIPTISKDKVSGLGTAAALNTGTASGNVVVVGSDGKISSDVLPNLAITDTFVVDSQAAMLALTAQVGDVAIRTDESKTYILKTTPATALANWQQLQTPACDIQSVNGKTGAVVLSYTDVGAEPVLSGSTAKATPVDADGVIIVDSAASNGTKKVLWSVVKSTLKTYFDTIYNKYVLPIATSSALGGVKLSTSDKSINIDTTTGIITVGDIDGGTF